MSNTNNNLNQELKRLRSLNLKITKKKVAEAATKDMLLVQSIIAVEETKKNKDNLTKHLREWYELYYPELSKKITDPSVFISKILQKDLNVETQMGGELSHEDLASILRLAKAIKESEKTIEYIENYLEDIMTIVAPNTKAVIGSLLGSKLIRMAGSLEAYAKMSSSTIQLLGAEKALFRHIKTGARPPKHGLIVQATLIQNTSKNFKGKAARAVSDKLAVAAKLDYFNGEFKGDIMRKELEEKIKAFK